MKSEKESKGTVLIVDDQDVEWLIDIIRDKGYTTILESTEFDAKECLRRTAEDIKSKGGIYKLAIFDVMVAIKSLTEAEDLDDFFDEESKDSGIRLCRYVRETLELTEKELPIVCLSLREDQDLKHKLRMMNISLFYRAAQDEDENSIIPFLDKHL